MSEGWESLDEDESLPTALAMFGPFLKAGGSIVRERGSGWTSLWVLE